MYLLENIIEGLSSQMHSVARDNLHHSVYFINYIYHQERPHTHTQSTNNFSPTAFVLQYI